MMMMMMMMMKSHRWVDDKTDPRHGDEQDARDVNLKQVAHYVMHRYRPGHRCDDIIYIFFING